MKHLRLLAFVLLWPASVLADYQAGVDAFAQGDYATAYREFLPLAEQEDADAQFNLALMYSNGVGVPQDYAEALKWYRLAAEQGYAKTKLHLGLLLGAVIGLALAGIGLIVWRRRRKASASV